MKISSLVLGFLLGCSTLMAQDSIEHELRGYVKYFANYSQLNRNFFEEPLRSSLSQQSFDHQIHNRFDYKVYAGAWTGAISMRNRLFNGSQLSQGGFFLDALDFDPGLVDLSFLYWRDDQIVLHTIFDRLWLQYENDRFLVRAGRQRINWGINSIWNPNDILNQYNFFDFDYEERPGADALRVQYFSSFTSSWEIAIAPQVKLNQSTAALLYRNNEFAYDFQFIGAYYRDNLSLGGGWAGHILDLGFKGEANYYYPLNSETDGLVFSTAIDYVFGNGLYLSASYLYNSSASIQTGINDFSAFGAGVVLSPKNPFPFQHTTAFSANYAFNPILGANSSLMYDPVGNNIIFFPSFTYSIANNLDALLAMQFFLTENNLESDQIQWLSNALFVRLKWSF